MALLDEAIEASGGLKRWNALNRFTLQLSIDGKLPSRANSPVRFKDIAAGGCLRNPLIRLTGFTGLGQSGVYQPDFVTTERPAGNVLRAVRNPHQAFVQHTKDGLLDELHLIFLFGCSVWNYLVTPFILAHPSVEVKELTPWNEKGQTWRRLRAVFSATSVTHCREQVFYFGPDGLQRRTDHDLYGIKVADYTGAHQEFDGIVVPTLRRALILEADGTVLPKPSLVDIEIFDAAFR
jgi:hypothetical protein